MKEWHRTIVLVVLLALAIGFIIWSSHSTDTNFVNTLH